MKLAERCSREFAPGDWDRGASYFRAGSVVLSKRSRAHIEADVQGSGPAPYQVVLNWSEAKQGYLAATCDCPRFADGYNCKHIAAAIRAVDAIGLGAQIPGRARLDLIEFDGVYEPDDDEFDDDEAIDLDDDEPGFGIDSVSDVLRLDKTSKHSARNRSKSKSSKPSAPQWKKQLGDLAALQFRHDEAGNHSTPRRDRPRLLWFALNLEDGRGGGLPYVTFHQTAVKKDGTLGKLTSVRLDRAEALTAASEDERLLLSLLLGNSPDYGYSNYGYNQFAACAGVAIQPALFDLLLPRLCATQRFGWFSNPSCDLDALRGLAWDDGPAWRLRVAVAMASDQRDWEIRGYLARGNEREPLDNALQFSPSGLVVLPDRLARYQSTAADPWLALLGRGRTVRVPVSEKASLMQYLTNFPSEVYAELPPALQWTEMLGEPVPHLVVKPPAKHAWKPDLQCRLAFRYGEWLVGVEERTAGHWQPEKSEMIRRNWEAERAASAELARNGAAIEPYNSYALNRVGMPTHTLAPKKLPALAAALTNAGWTIEAEGKLIRRPGEFKISVTSNVDWFDLEATCDFDGVTASLPKLLAALRHGESFVTLDDGSHGMLPTEWLRKFAPLAELGKTSDDNLRFAPSQAALLDALLAAQDSELISYDAAFSRLRDRLRSFDGVPPRAAPRTFRGELRPYQREGLGWLHFLRDFNFGGCLADDMGLGKTVQVLALLEQRRALANQLKKEKEPSTSLVVAPRSLIFNWIEEAERFTPKLRVLNYTGLERSALRDQLAEFDLVLTTYGTLRRDVAKLRAFRFDYAILDEAQAIKNASSQAAKACRLLQASHRLAMTGTPVENHLGELWSLLEYLNPGMLGSCGKLTDLFVNGRAGRASSEQQEHRQEAAQMLGRALRPFLLRRTKHQVLKDLPAKTEQTLHCELDAKERKLYDELREHYRQSLMSRIAKSGVKKSKIHVLEALLRLRQAACHPGLLDKKRAADSSSKLETLLEQLDEVLAEGHKALVFSQFTSLLAIVKKQLDKRGVVYEYLDGKTLDRQARVNRFQADEKCPLFLISLKAGGQGLNLTAADFVFILDPWWNPAVEAQAVDRAHRIGQQRPVTAYRLIARDTVEEKILQLQAQKRELADAIISADNSVLGNLTTEDLQLLLS